MTDAFETLTLSCAARIAHLQLDRPAVLNAFNMRMRDELSDVLDLLEAATWLDVLVITGKGRAFCAGADLSEFGTAPSPVAAREIRHRRDVWDRLRRLPQIVLVGIHGYCFGSGLEIVCLSDLRLAEEDALFAFPEMRLGMIPAAGGTQTLVRDVGPGRALETVLGGDRFTALAAFEMRLVTRVVAKGTLDRALSDCTERLLRHSSSRLRAMKALVRRSFELPGPVAAQAERAAFHSAG